MICISLKLELSLHNDELSYCVIQVIKIDSQVNLSI